MRIRVINTLFYLIFLISCSTAEEDLGPLPLAHPASYGADGFTLSSPAPDHSEDKKLIFYHKYCNELDKPSYFSRNSYFCDDLNYGD